MRTWYKLKKQAKLLLLFGAKNREAERELPDSAAQCQHPGAHQWKPVRHSDVSQEVSGGPTEGAYYYTGRLVPSQPSSQGVA